MATITTKEQSLSLTATAYDHTIYPTHQPPDDVIWSVDSQGLSYTGPDSTAFVCLATFWKAIGTFVFQASNNDNSKTITIGGQCSFGQGSANITIDIPNPINVVPRSGLETTQSGGQATFDVNLSVAPTDTVTLDIVSSDPSNGTASPSVLNFNPSNYTTFQTVTITGQPSGAVGDILYYLNIASRPSADYFYDSLNGGSVSVTNHPGQLTIEVDYSATASQSGSGTAQSSFRVSDDGSGVSGFTWIGKDDTGLDISDQSTLPPYVSTLAEPNSTISIVNPDKVNVFTIFGDSIATASGVGDTGATSMSYIVKVWSGSNLLYSNPGTLSASASGTDTEEHTVTITITTHSDGTFTVA